MKPSLLALAFTLVSGFATLFAAPEPGRYVGTVTITKGLGPEALLTTYTLKADARVGADGKITILTTVPEGPAAAVSVENSVTRLAPVPPPPAEITIPEEPRPFAGFNYVVDGQYGAELKIAGRVLTINYQVPAFTFVQTDPNSLSATLQAPPKYALFSFRFLKQK